MESRIRQISALLENAIVGETRRTTASSARHGRHRGDVRREGGLPPGPPRDQDGVDMHVFSERSPLGAAVNGKRVGDSVSCVAPTGKTIEVTIVHTTPYTE